MPYSDEALLELIDRQKIHDAIAAHARGIDRLDLSALSQAYWDDAVFDDELVQGPFREWGPLLIEMGARYFEATQHNIQNFTVRIEGTVAFAESYILSYHRTHPNRESIEATIGRDRLEELGGDVTRRYEFLAGGRNLDRLEKRSDHWKIARRRIAFDWNHTGLYTGIFAGGMYDALRLRGSRGRDDPSYRW
jgi:SnoaL-like domain